MKSFRQQLSLVLPAIRRSLLALVFCVAALPVFGTSDSPEKTFSSAESPTKIRRVETTETVEHLFTHCLISHPEIAFAKGNEYGKHLDRDCLTPVEFRRILGFLYEGGYALVDVNRTFRITGEYAERTAFDFPVDKKPLVLSFDDVVYATKNLGKGMSDKLVVTSDGEIAAYTESQTPKVHNREFVPILEEFIRSHPDFSYQNARGTIFLTGFDGILGYRTQRDSPNRASETEKAKEVVKVLKEKGWTFGCHSYAHGHMKAYTPEKMESDVRKWKEEVEPLVGQTVVYAYPYGEWILGENCSDLRQKALINAGFRLFCGVGENPFYAKMPYGNSTVKVLFQDRCALDGVSLRQNRCSRCFPAEKVYDNCRPVAFS